MDGSTSEPEASAEDRKRPAWERPTLTPLGDLKDLVRGLGKVTAPDNDMDATNMRKSTGQG